MPEATNTTLPYLIPQNCRFAPKVMYHNAIIAVLEKHPRKQYPGRIERIFSCESLTCPNIHEGKEQTLKAFTHRFI
jgi:hypothetical protein